MENDMGWSRLAVSNEHCIFLRAKYSISPFRDGLHFPRNIFYINPFSKEESHE